MKGTLRGRNKARFLSLKCIRSCRCMGRTRLIQAFLLCISFFQYLQCQLNLKIASILSLSLLFARQRTSLLTKMLRMRPTRIELDSRDHHWHNVRHDNRQRQRARVSEVEVATIALPYNSSTPLRTPEDPTSPSRNSSPSNSEDSGIVAAPQMPLFSKKPDTHRFWLGVMAGAGVLPEIRSTDAARPVLISGPSDHVSRIHSARGSFESDGYEDTRQYVEAEEWEKPKSTIEPPKVEQGDCKDHSSIPRTPLKVGSTREVIQGLLEGNRTALPSPRDLHSRRLSVLSIRRQGQREDDVRSLSRRDSNLRDLDGSSDPTPMLSELQDASTTATIQPESSEGPSFDERVQNDHSQAFAIISESPGTRPIAELLRMTGPSAEMYAIEPSASISSSLPRHVDNMRRRSSVFPRSPLYISHLAASSSPEKRPRPMSDTNELDVAAEMEMLSINSRQRKRYKRRSQSYPYLTSEAEPILNGHQYMDPTPINPPIPMGLGPTALARGFNKTHLTPSMTESESHAIAQDSPSNTSSSATVSPARLHIRPGARSFTPHYQSPYSLPLTIPPYAFSAVRRAVSFTPALPSSSSSPTAVPYNTPLYNHSAHSHPSVTPPPRTPSYAVYNDRLPASTQPQTPAGLSTNGVHRDGLPSIHSGAFTVPVGMARDPRSQHRRDTYDSASPSSRHGRVQGLRLDEQENERHGLETERRWRRQASLGLTRLDSESEGE